MSSVHQFPKRQPDPDPTPPAAPCQGCGGRRVVGVYIHHWRLGGSEWVGDTACTNCNGSGVEPAKGATP